MTDPRTCYQRRGLHNTQSITDITPSLMLRPKVPIRVFLGRLVVLVKDWS